jgi:8-oxo-dGTP pyrophosphatase MutT (NUDIX family)
MRPRLGDAHPDAPSSIAPSPPLKVGRLWSSYTVADTYYNVLPHSHSAEIKMTTSVQFPPIVSATVFHPRTTPDLRVLIIQRSPSDWMPLKWEPPGGSSDEGETIVAACVRELAEETGLRATAVQDVIGKHGWEHNGGWWEKIHMLVEVQDIADDDEEIDPSVASGRQRVQLDPAEHCAYLWATEAEVEASKCGDVVLGWTSWETKDLLLKAFKLVRQRNEEEAKKKLIHREMMKKVETQN